MGPYVPTDCPNLEECKKCVEPYYQVTPFCLCLRLRQIESGVRGKGARGKLLSRHCKPCKKARCCGTANPANPTRKQDALALQTLCDRKGGRCCDTANPDGQRLLATKTLHADGLLSPKSIMIIGDLQLVILNNHSGRGKDNRDTRRPGLLGQPERGILGRGLRGGGPGRPPFCARWFQRAPRKGPNPVALKIYTRDTHSHGFQVILERLGERERELY